MESLKIQLGMVRPLEIPKTAHSITLLYKQFNVRVILKEKLDITLKLYRQKYVTTIDIISPS